MLIYGFKNPTLRVPKKIEIHKALNIHLYFYAQLRRSVKDSLPEPRSLLGSGLKNRRSRIFQWILNRMVGAACELMPLASIQVTKENLSRFKS